MRSRTNKKIIVGLLIFVIAMSVGYAVFGQQLNITGTGSLDYDWDVHFDSQFTEDGITGQTAPVITADTITFNAVFTEPGQNKEYTFSVLNEGTIDAFLKSTTLEAGENNVAGITFDYSVSDTNGSIIPTTNAAVATVNTNTLAKTTGVHTVKVKLSYESDVPVTGTAKSATFTLKLNYEQK